MLLRAIRPFARHPRVREIVAALPAEVVSAPPDWLGPVAGDRLRLVSGGTARADSVRAALAALSPACVTVLVHDAARPFVDQDVVDAVIGAVAEGVAAVPAIPVADTLKQATDDLHVVRTVDRSTLWCAQTPQGFPRSMIEALFEVSGQNDLAGATDEASLAEGRGFPVRLVPGSSWNLKVTTEQDFEMADRLAAS
jgi:2-C-methyl-D-erythritol 4-phosphate cytidylyltransferase